ADLVESFTDGVWLVELTPLSDPALVTQTVAMTLGVREEQRPLIQTLLDHLKPKSLLLVLDNCEHVLSGSAGLVQTLLQACPQLRVLATSQEALGIAGEVAYRVPSLSMPDPDRLPPLDRLTAFESIRLFVDRAAAAAGCAGEGCERSAGFDILIRLVDRSLVIVENLDGRGTWYRLLETVRLYARADLVAAGEDETVRQRHRDWYLEFAENAEPELQGPALESWLARLEAEHDNIRAALDWCKTTEPNPEYGLRLAGAVWHFW